MSCLYWPFRILCASLSDLTLLSNMGLMSIFIPLTFGFFQYEWVLHFQVEYLVSTFTSYFGKYIEFKD